MKEFTTLFLLVLAVYLMITACLYVFQRKMIYYPTGLDPTFSAEEIRIKNGDIELHGWVLNPGKSGAVIYFGGNSELITHRRGYFEDVFKNYTVYLVNYRGYGLSQGNPGEAALLSDALAIFDQVSQRHDEVIPYGRSLGSGVAVYLATARPVAKLILLTPYDSIVEVAQGVYPVFPVRYLLKDRFDSAAIASQVKVPVFIATAELDKVVRPRHALALKDRLGHVSVSYLMIAGAAHNDIIDFVAYRNAVRQFIGE